VHLVLNRYPWNETALCEPHMRPAQFKFQSAHGMTHFLCQARSWNGIDVRHLQHFHQSGQAWHDLSSERATVTVVLDEFGGRCEAREKLNRPVDQEKARPHHISFVPAGMTIWGYSDGIESVRELRLSFDLASIRDLFGEDLATGTEDLPQLMRQDERIWQCASLLANECASPLAGNRLYGEGLTIALLAAMFESGAGSPPVRPLGLSKPQLKKVTDFLDDHVWQDVSLSQLAELTGLSESQFARSFKSSTGVPPYRFHLQKRIQRAQNLLLRRGATLASVAVESGFADQSHFTRTFRHFTGTTPRKWQRDRSS
jgi:AraC family transcriptional regulator